MILLDTHIWFWFLTADDLLRPELKKQIESAPQDVIISPISVWELLVLNRKRRVELKPAPDKFIRDALYAYPFDSAPLTHEIAIFAETLEFKHFDPADRLLAATAYAYQVSFATDDGNLRELSWLVCI